MSDFFKELNIIDILGIGVPGCLLVLLLCGDQTGILLYQDLFGSDNAFALGIFLIVFGSIAGMLIQEIGDLIEKGLWLFTWLDPKTYAAYSVGPDRIINAELRKNVSDEPPIWAVRTAGWTSVLLTIVILVCAVGLHIPAICKAYEYVIGKSVTVTCRVYLGLFPFLLLGVLALIMFTAVWSAGRKDSDKIQVIRHSNPYMQTHLVGLGNTSKRTLYDGFRFVMRNLIIVLAIVNLFSLWFPIDLYQQITRYISSNGIDFTTNMTWITVFISALVVVMLVRYYHYAILRYKYSLEDYMMHNRDGKSMPSEENREKKRKNDKAKRPYSHSH